MKPALLPIFLTLCLAACNKWTPAPPPAPAPAPAVSPAPQPPAQPTKHVYTPETPEQLKARLTPLQWQVTQEAGTERPYTNEFDHHFEEGIYVSIVSGTPLFSSKDKFDSGCGWPAFTKPIDEKDMKNLKDLAHGMERIEVRASDGAHLGHVFDDGPKDKGGQRYCINSASLRFVPKAKMAEAGYGHLLSLFEQKPAAKP